MVRYKFFRRNGISTEKVRVPRALHSNKFPLTGELSLEESFDVEMQNGKFLFVMDFVNILDDCLHHC